MPDPKKKSQDFEQIASKRQPGLIREFLQFLVHNRKWWLVPIIVLLLILGLLVVLQTAGVAFIYPV